MNEILNIGYNLFILMIVFVLAYIISKTPILRRFFLPVSLIAGLILLCLGPQIAGRYFPEYALTAEMYDVWKPLPGLLINVVFACLFLAHPIISLRKIWKLAGPQVAYGQMIAWGHYVVGGVAALLILTPLLGEKPIIATLLEASFEGGHGTVAGLGGVYANFDFLYGQEIANALATASLITAITVGVLIINIGKRLGLLKFHGGHRKNYHYTMLHTLERNSKILRGRLNFRKVLKHLVLIAISIIIGLILRQLLIDLEKPLGIHLFAYLPTFPLCMLGGLIVNSACIRLKIHVSHTANDMISKLALGVLICTAIGTMSLDFISQGGGVSFIILYLAGAIWIFVAMILFARKIFKRHWFENMIISFGQSMGMTATGLLFAQIIDPNNKTEAVDAFGYKQLMFEPFMGGGLITAIAIPTIVAVGLPTFTLVCTVIAIFWCLMGVFYFGKRSAKLE
jgi:ESS family glutamate:Na+ symporter